ncbi:helix-turn-helix domain-containing protein [Candidatus Saccharibacteria bacterium]|nr:helix-turn-helix domain-containing protein [Candidatus Saccharibacteria bacterium]
MKRTRTNPRWKKFTYSFEEAAERLTASVEDVEEMISQGILRVVQTGRSRSIPIVDVSEYVDHHAK